MIGIRKLPLATFYLKKKILCLESLFLEKKSVQLLLYLGMIPLEELSMNHCIGKILCIFLYKAKVRNNLPSLSHFFQCHPETPVLNI